MATDRGPFKGPRARGPFEGPRGPLKDVAALWGPIEFLNFLRVGSWSFWGCGRPRGTRRPFKKGGGEAPRPSEMATEAPGAAQTPKMTDVRSLNYPSATLTRRWVNVGKLWIALLI